MPHNIPSYPTWPFSVSLCLRGGRCLTYPMSGMSRDPGDPRILYAAAPLQTIVIPTTVKRPRALFSAGVGRRDLVLALPIPAIDAPKNEWVAPRASTRISKHLPHNIPSYPTLPFSVSQCLRGGCWLCLSRCRRCRAIPAIPAFSMPPGSSPTIVIPTTVKRPRALFSAGVGRRDLVLALPLPAIDAPEWT